MFKKKAQAQTTRAKSSKKREKVTIGSGWLKENRDGSEYITLAFKGSYEKDEVEVILRSKEDGSELNLSETGGIMFANGYKEKENQPDMVVQAYLPNEDEE
jgi:hypothetical protein